MVSIIRALTAPLRNPLETTSKGPDPMTQECGDSVDMPDR